LFVQESNAPLATQTASDGTPLVGGVVVCDGVGDGLVVPETLPVQVVPLSVKLVGAGLLPFCVPLKPNDTVAFVAMDPL
jgi:hypothetical protein